MLFRFRINEIKRSRIKVTKATTNYFMNGSVKTLAIKDKQRKNSVKICNAFLSRDFESLTKIGKIFLRFQKQIFESSYSFL